MKVGKPMLTKTFFWIEDRKGKAGYVFWKTFMQQLCPEVIVESKKNNSELVKAVKLLNDTINKYVIVFDNSFDNAQVYLEQKRLKQYVDEKENVYLMDIICFEYILLEFDKLINWVFASEDELLVKRTGIIAARKKLVENLKAGEVNYKELQEIVDYDNNIVGHNIEQLASKLLFDLTRNTGFEVSKGAIGKCWIEACCDWNDRKENDICGLDRNRLSVKDKMRSIYTGTSLNTEFLKAGLGVLV